MGRSHLTAKLRRKGRLEWMEEIMGIETWVHDEAWQAGTDEVDVHDTFAQVCIPGRGEEFIPCHIMSVYAS